jgi:alkyldihydroxyacetonephosphate synthase
LDYFFSGLLGLITGAVLFGLTYQSVFPGIVKIANYNRIPVIPAGGTSGTIGGILAVKGGIVIDMKRMNRLVDLDPYSLTVTVQTGMLGQDYEDQLNMRGFIGGHYPQSIRCSTVGGWIAPRGVGTFSS